MVSALVKFVTECHHISSLKTLVALLEPPEQQQSSVDWAAKVVAECMDVASPVAGSEVPIPPVSKAAPA